MTDYDVVNSALGRWSGDVNQLGGFRNAQLVQVDGGKAWTVKKLSVMDSILTWLGLREHDTSWIKETSYALLAQEIDGVRVDSDLKSRMHVLWGQVYSDDTNPWKSENVDTRVQAYIQEKFDAKGQKRKPKTLEETTFSKLETTQRLAITQKLTFKNHVFSAKELDHLAERCPRLSELTLEGCMLPYTYHWNNFKSLESLSVIGCRESVRISAPMTARGYVEQSPRLLRDSVQWKSRVAGEAPKLTKEGISIS